ncbi:ThiF family adenylyltransferase [Desulfovibrio sp. JC022]|uniref:HesA/MoeB/ThiF family protein n=1 Tax=Desulfovibrio sp. JC022 TaxID=2593642 RepID=UPI0013D2E786|nr:ThiF family adenylyltransferase [Desulfovibrio sp. JC022]NDV21586.1 thiamine biosynthesis protein ThiF [Desulfovibrio sp. JC022]
MKIDIRVSEMLSGRFTEKIYASGEKVRIAPHAVVREISRELGLDVNCVERAVFSHEAVPERYVRNLSTFTAAEQRKLFFSKVAMVGIGGLGGHLLESLARVGVGHITACDGDCFEPSNLNRQRFAVENSLYSKKSEAAFEMIREVNPAVFLDVRSDFIEDDFESFIRGADLVADCLGGLAYRTKLKEAAANMGIPMVTASVAGWSGIVSTVYPGNNSPADFFGSDNGLEEELGTPVPAISTAVGIQSGEILKVLSGKDPALAGKALMFDLSKLYFDTVSI